MKKLIFATLALSAIAFTSNAQLVSTVNSTNTGRASDQSSVNLTVVVPNVLTMTPDNASSTVTLTEAQTMLGGANYISLPSNTWTIWSNREYFVYYQANTTDNYHLNYSNTTGATDDGDESHSMPMSNLQMRVSSNNTGGSISNGYNNYRGLSHSIFADHNSEHQSSIAAGTELIDEAVAGNRTFQTDYQILSPGYNYVGGTYTATVYIWAIQE